MKSLLLRLTLFLCAGLVAATAADSKLVVAFLPKS